MTTHAGAAYYPIRKNVPLSWSYSWNNLELIGSASVIPFVGVIDYFSNFSSNISPGSNILPIVGYQECFVFRCVNPASVAGTFERWFSPDNVFWFMFESTPLPSSPGGVFTTQMLTTNMRTLPAFPFFRTRFVNNDAVNSLFVWGTYTLRAR